MYACAPAGSLLIVPVIVMIVQEIYIALHVTGTISHTSVVDYYFHTAISPVCLDPTRLISTQLNSTT